MIFCLGIIPSLIIGTLSLIYILWLANNIDEEER